MPRASWVHQHRAIGKIDAVEQGVRLGPSIGSECIAARMSRERDPSRDPDAFAGPVRDTTRRVKRHVAAAQRGEGGQFAIPFP